MNMTGSTAMTMAVYITEWIPPGPAILAIWEPWRVALAAGYMGA